MDFVWGSHLCADVLRWRVDLNADLGDHGDMHGSRFNLGLLFKPFLVLHERDIVITSHALLSATVGVPGCIWDLLHLKKSVRC